MVSDRIRHERGELTPGGITFTSDGMNGGNGMFPCLFRIPAFTGFLNDAATGLVGSLAFPGDIGGNGLPQSAFDCGPPKAVPEETNPCTDRAQPIGFLASGFQEMFSLLTCPDKDRTGFPFLGFGGIVETFGGASLFNGLGAQGLGLGLGRLHQRRRLDPGFCDEEISLLSQGVDMFLGFLNG
jgi:hypothetical protein